RTISHSCRCRRAHPNSTARKTSGSSCVRIGCQTGFSNPSTISSTTAATLGTHSSTSPGRLCPSRDATGQQSVTQSEDWYYSAPAARVRQVQRKAPPLALGHQQPECAKLRPISLATLRCDYFQNSGRIGANLGGHSSR